MPEKLTSDERQRLRRLAVAVIQAADSAQPHKWTTWDSFAGKTIHHEASTREEAVFERLCRWWAEPGEQGRAPNNSGGEQLACSEWLDLLAGWRTVEQACENLGSGLSKTTQTQIALEYCTKAETWRRAIADLERVVGGLASKSNLRLDDGKNSSASQPSKP